MARLTRRGLAPRAGMAGAGGYGRACEGLLRRIEEPDEPLPPRPLRVPLIDERRHRRHCQGDLRATAGGKWWARDARPGMSVVLAAKTAVLASPALPVDLPSGWPTDDSAAHLHENRKRATEQAAPLNLIGRVQTVRAVRIFSGRIPVQVAVGRRRDRHRIQQHVAERRAGVIKRFGTHEYKVGTSMFGFPLRR